MKSKLLFAGIVISFLSLHAYADAKPGVRHQKINDWDWTVYDLTQLNEIPTQLTSLLEQLNDKKLLLDNHSYSSHFIPENGTTGVDQYSCINLSRNGEDRFQILPADSKFPGLRFSVNNSALAARDIAHVIAGKRAKYVWSQTLRIHEPTGIVVYSYNLVNFNPLASASSVVGEAQDPAIVSTRVSYTFDPKGRLGQGMELTVNTDTTEATATLVNRRYIRSCVYDVANP